MRMRSRIVALTALVSIVAGCTSAPPPGEDNPYLGTSTESRSAEVVYLGGDGSSCDDAVVIKGAINTFEGIAAENRWLEEHYSDGERISTKTGDCPDRITDVVVIRQPDGSLETILFDISEFYGKW